MPLASQQNHPVPPSVHLYIYLCSRYLACEPWCHSHSERCECTRENGGVLTRKDIMLSERIDNEYGWGYLRCCFGFGYHVCFCKPHRWTWKCLIHRPLASPSLNTERHSWIREKVMHECVCAKGLYNIGLWGGRVFAIGVDQKQRDFSFEAFMKS